MHSLLRRSVLGGVLVFAVVLATACGAGGGGPSGPSSGATRLGFQATTWGAPAIVADRAGSWKDAGANVTTRPLSSGAEVRDAILGGSLDAGSLGVTPYIVGAAKGQVVAVAVAAYAGDTLAVVTGKDSAIHSVADLRGKKIASQLGSDTNETFVDQIAPAAGLSKSDFQLVNMKFQDMYSALQTGQVDAFAGVDPTVTLAVQKGTGRILTTYAKYDPTPLYLCFTKSYIDRNRDEVQKVVNGWVAGAKVFNSDPQRALNEVKGFFDSRGSPIDTAVLQQALSNLHVTPDFGPDTQAYLNQQADALVKARNITAKPDWSKAIDTSFLKKAESGQ
ncbi:ABC transporter substrate-binding protein [Amycolatopsis sp. K13G38]|uniref:ABC transporter substrate-binding protein n=1 Tax=Amycolatopsis acididurans TaxID=2724524 RepID=A0ABX1J2F6_9PSEU|nr:ABC transporter substrate-binding protein [Amycolatopsis acididurans]NKQ52540.1 ABC transporter substrate-binding protein [Amycolatopsis acididurans]